jgi:long-subunit fatty acid transport protein
MRLASRALSVLLVISCSGPVHATGFFSGNKGARAAGRAGAFTAKADDVTAIVFNPAGLSRLGGTVLQAGNRFSYNAHAYTREPTLDWGNLEGGVPPLVNFEEVENETPWQLLEPFLGVATNFGLPDFGFGLAAYAAPGISRQDFPLDGGQRFMMVEREAMILNYALGAAWQQDKRFGVGLSLVWVSVPKLDYQLVINSDPLAAAANPVSSELDMLATVKGADPFTFNAIVGVWFRPVPFLELALSGQVVPSQIETDSTLDVEPLSPATVEEVELYRNGEPADDVTLTLPLPLTARLGVRYLHLEEQRERFDVELDLVYESWSRVDRFRLDGNGLEARFLGQRVDISRIDIEKEWRDTLSVQLGSDYHVIPDVCTVRAGAFFESAVADPANAHVDFVSGKQIGATLGASVFAKNFEIALSYEYRHQPEVEVSEAESRVFQETPASSCLPPYTDPDTCHEQYFGQPGPAVNAGSYRAHSQVAQLDVIYRF